jgi:hypothetical protein
MMLLLEQLDPLGEYVISKAGVELMSRSFRQHGEQMLGLGNDQAGQTLQEASDAIVSLSRLSREPELILQEGALAVAQITKYYAPLFTLAKQVYTVAAQDKHSSSANVSQAWFSTPRYANGVEKLGGMEPVQPTKVGFVGLGAMGMGMAKVLHNAGVNVTGYDVWKPSSERYAAAGGTVAATLAECAAGSDVFLLMVINAQQAEDVLFTHGALQREFLDCPMTCFS